MSADVSSPVSGSIKRLLDVLVSAVSLILLAPVGLLIGIAVRISSPGPVFFKQTRVGRAFRPFTILKFRSMRDGSDGPSITIGGDSRVTRVGRFLRSTKLDELPQLWNVLRGDMSLVGPRPELPMYVDLFRKDYAEILSVRPGITDFASFQYRDEELILARSADPEWEYANVILPTKVELGKRYVRRASLLFDIGILVKTVLELLWNRTRRIRSLLLAHRRLIVVVLHVSMAAVSYYLAWWFRFDGDIPPIVQRIAVEMLPVVLIVRAVSLYYFRLYQGLWRFTDIWDVERIFLGVVVGQAAVVLIIRFGFGVYGFPRAVFLLDAMLFMFSMVATRLVWRAYIGLGQFEPNLRAVIVGPHALAALLALALRANRGTDRLVVGLVDMNRDHVGLHIHDIPVVGSIADLSSALHRAAPDEILVVGQLDGASRQLIAEAAAAYGVLVRDAPDLTQMLSGPAIQEAKPIRVPAKPADTPSEAHGRSTTKLAAGLPSPKYPDRQQCPRCGEVAARRIRILTLFDRTRRALTSRRPFRCESCRQRYWLEPTAPRAPQPPPRSVDLIAIDDALQKGHPEVDLHQ